MASKSGSRKNSSGRIIEVNDLMQRGYVYKLVEPEGRNFSPEFRPQLSPAEMLRLGVFGGKYMTDCRHEFPARWFKGAKLAPQGLDTFGRPPRLVPVVLPLLARAAHGG